VRTSWEPPGPAMLFCPADRPDRFAKAAAAADVVILDLEDGVAPSAKELARTSLRESSLDPASTVVRLNSTSTEDHVRDLDALAATPYDVVMLAKTERAAQVHALSSFQVIALVETPIGVLAAPEITAAGVVGVMWGAEDLIAALGGRSSRLPDGRFRDVAKHARSMVLLAAGANGVSAIDSVFIDISDRAGLAEQAADAAASGFDAVACIHPSQVTVVRDAFRPTAAEVDWASRVVAAAVGAPGVFTVDGRMVDVPVIRHAQNILDRSARAQHQA
jgi:citrate lyase subunit beta / citryl-CoA lyase